MSKKTIIIGDVHGCIDEMRALVQQTNYRAGTDDLIFVGDLINRGPDSLAVWKYFTELGARSVIGNHELHLIRDSRGISVKKRWIADFKTAFGDQFQPFLTDISSWPTYIETDQYMVVHGGIVPESHPKDTDPTRLTSIRTFDPKTGDLQSEESQPWFDFYNEEKLVVFGHWAKLGGVQRPNVIGLDTGCVYGKKLTALVLPDRELVSVAAKKVYCPINPKDHQG